MGDQLLMSPDGQLIRGDFRGVFRRCGGGPASGNYRVFADWFLIIGESERREHLAQVPGEVGGEHAQQHVRPEKPNRHSPHTSSPSVALAYGSSSSFAGLQRSPRAGSYGPVTRSPKRWPVRTPGTNPCHTPSSSAGSGRRVSAPAASNRHSTTCSAISDATAKLVPDSSGVAPRGTADPARSPIAPSRTSVATAATARSALRAAR